MASNRNWNVPTLLSGWEKNTFGHVKRELRRLEKESEKLRNEPHRSGPTHAELKIVEKVLELHHREELMWKQAYVFVGRP